jgi:hypothetical protein
MERAPDYYIICDDFNDVVKDVCEMISNRTEPMKYNKEISDWNSENQKSNDVHRIGNTIFNKCGNGVDRAAWLRFKEYVARLEKRIILVEKNLSIGE